VAAGKAFGKEKVRDSGSLGRQGVV